MRRSLLELAATIALAAASAAHADERVALTPERKPPWRVSHVFAALRDGAREPRELRIESTPPGAQLELAYLRDGAQLAHAAGVAPLVATLPSRVFTGERDRILVRAQLADHAPRDLTLDARELGQSIRVELAPLPRALLGIALLELGAHERLELISDRPLAARLAASERGWRLELADVSASPAFIARLEALTGSAISRSEVRVVGSDWIVELARSPGETRVPRLSQNTEAVRSVSHLALEWLPTDRDEASRSRARAALAQGAGRLGACDSQFEDALIAGLGRETIDRSLAPSGAFTDAYVALALDALAARSPEAELALRDGASLRLDGPIARASAAARASSVRRLLVAIRAIAEALAPRGAALEALHAWLAPERAPAEFAAAYARASDAETSCRARS